MSLNLRAGNTQIPGPVYSGSYAWGTDVITGTGILNIFNPTTTKTIHVLNLSVGGWNSGNQARAVVFNVCRSNRSAAGTTVYPIRFDNNDPVASAGLEAGGGWILGNSYRIVTCSASTGQLQVPIEIESEITLKYGEALSVVFSAESGTQVFYPNASITWYEV